MRNSERFYRDFSDTDAWKTFRVKSETTDLYIRAESDLSTEAEKIITELREELREHIKLQEEFLSAYKPIERISTYSEIVMRMYDASERAGVGPMAAVAGIIAEETGRRLRELSDEIIIENGGDIWLAVKRPLNVSIYADTSPFSGAIALRILPEDTPVGICTSSGKVGHSFSYGDADAVTIVSKDTALADAVATEAANMVKDEASLQSALEYALGIEGIRGALIIYRDKLAAQGEIELARPGETPSVLRTSPPS